MINMEQFDCGPPGLHPYRDNLAETRDMESQTWCYHFLRVCLVPVLNSVVAVKRPKYSDVLNLDKKIRAYEMPKHVQGLFYDEAEKGRVEISKGANLQYSGTWTLKDICKNITICSFSDY